MAGAYTWVESMKCGVDFSLVFNTRQWDTECVGDATACPDTTLVNQLFQLFEDTFPGFAECWGSEPNEL